MTLCISIRGYHTYLFVTPLWILAMIVIRTYLFGYDQDIVIGKSRIPTFYVSGYMSLRQKLFYNGKRTPCNIREINHVKYPERKQSPSPNIHKYLPQKGTAVVVAMVCLVDAFARSILNEVNSL